MRADRVLDAARDRDVRAVIHRLLDRELAGWAALAAALLLLGLIPSATQSSPWLLAATILAAPALGVAGWRVLAVVRAAKRRQVWLNTHRPAPHLERHTHNEPGRPSPAGQDTDHDDEAGRPGAPE